MQLMSILMEIHRDVAPPTLDQHIIIRCKPRSMNVVCCALLIVLLHSCLVSYSLLPLFDKLCSCRIIWNSIVLFHQVVSMIKLSLLCSFMSYFVFTSFCTTVDGWLSENALNKIVFQLLSKLQLLYDDSGEHNERIMAGDRLQFHPRCGSHAAVINGQRTAHRPQ